MEVNQRIDVLELDIKALKLAEKIRLKYAEKIRTLEIERDNACKEVLNLDSKIELKLVINVDAKLIDEKNEQKEDFVDKPVDVIKPVNVFKPKYAMIRKNKGVILSDGVTEKVVFEYKDDIRELHCNGLNHIIFIVSETQTNFDNLYILDLTTLKVTELNYTTDIHNHIDKIHVDKNTFVLQLDNELYSISVDFKIVQIWSASLSFDEVLIQESRYIFWQPRIITIYEKSQSNIMKTLLFKNDILCVKANHAALFVSTDDGVLTRYDINTGNILDVICTYVCNSTTWMYLKNGFIVYIDNKSNAVIRSIVPKYHIYQTQPKKSILFCDDVMIINNGDDIEIKRYLAEIGFMREPSNENNIRDFVILDDIHPKL